MIKMREKKNVKFYKKIIKNMIKLKGLDLGISMWVGLVRFKYYVGKSLCVCDYMSGNHFKGDEIK
jgi:hypothetical protein